MQLQREIEAFEQRGIRIVAASIDTVEDIGKMRKSAGASFDFLSDPEGRLLDQLGVRHEGAHFDGRDLAQSASFLIGADGTVLWREIAANYRSRPAPSEILEAADRVLSAG